MKVSQEPIKLANLLESMILKVPLNQREYSWTLDEVSDLYYDLIESELDNTSAGHFLGALLLYRSENKRYAEVFDGQQRITTLFLFLYTILNELKASNKNKAIQKLMSLLFIIDPNDLSDDINSSEPRLEIAKRDKKLFKSIIKGENYEIHKDGRKKSHRNLTNALEFFKNHVTEIHKNEGLDALVELTSKIIKCEFIVMTAEKEADLLLLFKTINARGRELTQADMIKNELCHHIDDDDVYDFIEQWDEIRTELEKNSGDLDTFLFHYINSIDESQELRQVKDKKRGITNWKKNNYPPIPEKLVFDIYCDYIRSVGAQKFIDDLKLAVQHYVLLISPNDTDLSLIGLKAMGVNKCFPLLLKSSMKYQKNEFDGLSQAIESLTFRHSILRKDPKELEKFYYLQIDRIKNNLEIQDVIQDVKNHENFKEEERFKNEFLLCSPKMSVSKMILDRIVRNSNESVNWNNKDVHIEHIMPRKPKGEWLTLYEKDPQEYTDYLNRLGNLTILQDKKNIRASNKNFVDKQKYYATSRLIITGSLVKYKTWDYTEICNRQESLFNIVKEIWS